MSDNKKAVNPAETVNSGVEETKVKKVVNKGVYSCKLLCAKVNKNGDKVGVAVLDYKEAFKNGQLDVLSVESPVITSWLPVTERLAQLINLPILTDIGCVLSGEGGFTQLHDVLTDEQYASYLAIVGR